MLEPRFFSSPLLPVPGHSSHATEAFFFLIIYFNWRLITLPYCSGFCHTLTWVSHGWTCVPHHCPPPAIQLCKQHMRLLPGLSHLVPLHMLHPYLQALSLFAWPTLSLLSRTGFWRPSLGKLLSAGFSHSPWCSWLELLGVLTWVHIPCGSPQRHFPVGPMLRWDQSLWFFWLFLWLLVNL